MNIVKSVLKHSEQKAELPAISYKENGIWKSYTWKEFKTLIFKTANSLSDLGIKKNDKVAIYGENSAEWLITDLAVLSLGGITVPIYATNTAEQAKYIVDDAEIKAILVGNQFQYDNALRVYAESSTLENIITVKDDIETNHKNSCTFRNLIKDASEEFEIVDKENDDLATLIYTSGTTGEPKGTMITHGNFSAVFENHISFLPFLNHNEKEKSLAFLPLSHVFERSWTLLMLHCGTEVFLLGNPKTIAEELKIVRPTMMCCVPRLYQKIYAAIIEKMKQSSKPMLKLFNWALKSGIQYSKLKVANKNIPYLTLLKFKIADKIVFRRIKNQIGGRLWFMPVGGASITQDITEFFDAVGIHLTVGYGLTETTATVSAFPLEGYKHGTAGKPMNGVQIKIGENDEILVKGNNVMKGYYNKPEATREVLDDEGWFKTGDAGKFDEEGNLIIIDRIKDLMKTSNGKYITPQPIENMLTNDNFIQQAVVIGDNKPYVTALVVPNFEALKEMAKKIKLDFKSHEELINFQKIKEFYNQRINQIQKNLANFEKIKKIHLLPYDFNMELGEITPTLKVRRKIVIEKFAFIIDEMYKK